MIVYCEHRLDICVGRREETSNKGEELVVVFELNDHEERDDMH